MEGLCKQKLLGFIISDLESLGWALRIFIPYKLSNDADAADLGMLF